MNDPHHTATDSKRKGEPSRDVVGGKVERVDKHGKRFFPSRARRDNARKCVTLKQERRNNYGRGASV